MAAEVSGRIASLMVEEGDRVSAGQPLLSLEDDLVRLRVAAADANVAAAQAQLALVEAGARPAEVRRAEARVEQARAVLSATTQALTDAEAIRADPQSLRLALAQAEVRAETATLQLTAASRQAEAADLEARLWEEVVRLLWEGMDVVLPGGVVQHFDTPAQKLTYAQNEWNKATHAAWQAWADVTLAQANATAAEASLNDLKTQLADPIALDARVNQAWAARDKAAAGLQAAQAALQALHEGASPAQRQAARAALDQSRAARATLDQELARYRLAAPTTGTVARIFYRPGEVAIAGTPLLRLSLAGDLTLRVFVATETLSRVHLEQPVTVRVDALAGETFTGTVSYIADRAEFTGRQAQTDSERNARLVAVEVKVQNPDGRLKAGMPATVVFGVQ